MNVKQLSASLGAECTNFDLASKIQSMKDTQIIQDLLLKHQVLFFPKQHLTVEQHVQLGKYFAQSMDGHLQGHPNLKLLGEAKQHKEIFEMQASAGGVADEWHTDLTFLQHPAKLSIMKMVKAAEIGGDTLFTNLSDAYDDLSLPMKDMCDGLTALHDADPHDKQDSMAIHPVVRIHPVTKRKALYVNEHFTRRIVELEADESKTLLEYLCSHVIKPKYTVRYSWQTGGQTIAFWDNSCTQHCVLQNFNTERIIQRVTIMGDRPEGSIKLPKYDSILEQHLKKMEIDNKNTWVQNNTASGRKDRQLFNFLRSQRIVSGKL